MHYHNKVYRTITVGDDCPHLIGTTMATILTISALALTSGAVVGSSMYGAAQEEKQQKKLIEAQEGMQKTALDFQTKQVADAEAKVAGAEKLAAEQAATTLKKKRAAQTNTILTSPLGISGEANVGMTRLLGG